MTYHTITVLLGNTAPTSSCANFRAVRDVWRIAADCIVNWPLPATTMKGEPSKSTWYLTLDADDVLDFLAACEACEEGNDQPLVSRMHRMRALNDDRGLLTSSLVIRIDGIEEDERQHDVVLNLGRFLQRLFLAMNLAVPGSLHMLYAQYGGLSEERVPRLHAGVLEEASEIASDHGWPRTAPVDFTTVWKWLDQVLPHDLEIAEEPLHRALFSLLRLCSIEFGDLTGVLIVAQALEALLSSAKDQIGATLKRRIYAVLGEPETHKSWFSKFYEARSRVAHGDLPLLRPNSMISDHSRVYDHEAEQRFVMEQATAVLVAILRDLASSGSDKYLFREEIERIHV